MTDPSRPRPVPGPPRPGGAPPADAAGSAGPGAVPPPVSADPDGRGATGVLEGLGGRPVAEHVAVFEAEHDRLQRELATIDQL